MNSAYKDPLWKVVLAILLWAVVVWANFFYIVTASSAELSEMEPFIVFCFLLTAFGYFYLRKKYPKFFAVLAILLALISNHYQIKKLAQVGPKSEMADRLTIIVAGVAVIGKGFKDYGDAVEKEQGSKKQAQAAV